MSTHSHSTSQTHSYASWLRRVRLWSGIVLCAYVTTHLANHALGLISFAALALLGFVQAGREVSAQAREPGWLQELLQTTNAPDAVARQSLDRVRIGVPGIFGAAIGAILVVRAIRRRFEPRLETIQITYPDGQKAIVPAGFSVLEASRFAKIPHASVCGGRERCSTPGG